MKTNPNDPISFIPESEKDRYDHNHELIFTGLTKREAFAMAAMQGICAHHDTWGKESFEKIARASTEMADALITELNKSEQ